MRPASSLATRTVIICIRCRTVSRVRTVSSYAAGVYCARYGSKAALRQSRIPSASSKAARLTVKCVVLVFVIKPSKTTDGPALIVVGDEDAFTSRADADVMHRLLRQSELVWITDAGQMPNLERETRFNEALLAFLRRLPASAVIRTHGHADGVAGP
jgi:pimeloyl-ACP methyl ester carboxylesterase